MYSEMSIFKTLKILDVKMYICIKFAHYFQVFLAGKNLYSSAILCLMIELLWLKD